MDTALMGFGLVVAGVVLSILAKEKHGLAAIAAATCIAGFIGIGHSLTNAHLAFLPWLAFCLMAGGGATYLAIWIQEVLGDLRQATADLEQERSSGKAQHELAAEVEGKQE
jgi:hypothetical protein